MLSPTRTIAVGALTLAVGSAMVIARPFHQAEDAAPGAQAGAKAAAPVEFTGTGSERDVRGPRRRPT